jgi:hypothetical protein
MTFCAAPFVHMVQNPDGQYRTCCMYEKPLEGKYNDIKEAFDGKENQKIRQRMLSGEQLPECKKCDIDEMHDGKCWTSYRQEFNTKYEKKYIDDPILKTLEISVSNKCNFKCIDCGPRFSNQFGKTIINNLPNYDNFNELDHLKILGGELFLDKRNFELFRKIPRENINLFIITNNSIFPNDEILNLLLDFKHIDINISIDGIQEIAEFVRFGTKWSKFEKNWNKWFNWQSKIGKHQVFIEPHFVMHTLNAPFYQDTLDWSNVEIEKWSWDFLNEPAWLNIKYLPEHIKEYILRKNEKFDEAFNGSLTRFLSSNSYSEKHFLEIKQYILNNNIPKQMDEYMDLFF